MQTSGAMRREIANVISVVVVREGGATQYSRDAVIEPWPRRTGYLRLRGV